MVETMRSRQPNTVQIRTCAPIDPVLIGWRRPKQLRGYYPGCEVVYEYAVNPMKADEVREALIAAEVRFWTG